MREHGRELCGSNRKKAPDRNFKYLYIATMCIIGAINTFRHHRRRHRRERKLSLACAIHFARERERERERKEGVFSSSVSRMMKLNTRISFVCVRFLSFRLHSSRTRIASIANFKLIFKGLVRQSLQFTNALSLPRVNE